MAMLQLQTLSRQVKRQGLWLKLAGNTRKGIKPHVDESHVPNSIVSAEPAIVSVVLSGGAGTRLWPASREGHPKPFIKLSDGETLIYKTYLRAKRFSTIVLTVTNRDYYFMSREEQNQAGIDDGSFLLEPFGRNTAPAVALAAKLVEKEFGTDAVMLVLPADHLITDLKKLDLSVSCAANLAREGYLVTFGLVPSSPETGYGYIEKGCSLETAYKVNRFVEKPDINRAKSYVDSGQYLWNSGMFCFKAGVFLEELRKNAPEISALIYKCWINIHQRQSGLSMIEIPADQFKDMPNISVDYAVMEKSDKVAVVEGDFGWSDIGSWTAVRELVQPDLNHNRAIGEVLFVESHNNFVQAEDRLVAVLGVKDLMIIDSPDALLVAHPEKSQDVKKIVANLKANQHDALIAHRSVVRPWGTYTVLEEGPGFKIKRIEVKPHASLSLQLHHHRSEHWVVVHGIAKVTSGDTEVLLQANESAYIPAKQKHRLENPGDTLCVMIEVQCGDYLGEDDIVRFDDKYGRKN